MDLKTAIHILGLQNCQSTNDVKAAFRDLAHRYHPDKNRQESASDDFARILQAYQYCLAHFAELQSTLRESFAKRENATDTTPLENFDDIFTDLFGLRNLQLPLGYEEPQTLTLTKQELSLGGMRTEKMRVSQQCQSCVGLGGVKPKLCRYCFGAGAVTAPQTQAQKTCPKCLGRGREIETLCSACDGFGKTFSREVVAVTLPKDLQIGETLWLNGQSVKSGQKRQLYLHIALAPDKIHQNDSPLRRAWKAFLWLFKIDS